MKEVSIEEIKKVERILLPKGYTFGEKGSERVKVISEIENKLDVVACPGSGKTTVLLAKLLILADRMPFENDRGICVLTHTNVAIDEIKNKIGNTSSKLFSYPNFFGTIQSFVDKYLAVPALIKYYETRPSFIDSEKANKRLLYSFKGLNKYENKLHTYLWSQLYDNVATIKKEDIITFFEIKKEKENDFIDKMVSSEILEKETKTKYKLSRKANKTYIKKTLSDPQTINRFICIKEEIERIISIEKEDKIINFTLDFLKSKVLNNPKSFSFTSNSGKEFIKLKETLFKDGVLTYRDAFDIANRYIYDYKELKNSFSQRFKYVFVDEMQDTDKHQLDIIKGLFEKTDTITQYFGDPNQAIFNYIKEGMVWKPEETGRLKLNISDSKRFGENIAEVLNKIKVDESIHLTGNKEIKSLKPHLILFNTGEEDKVLEIYTKIITKHENEWLLKLKEQNKKPVYKAIGWVAKERTEQEITENKLNIKSYYNNFQKKSEKQKQLYSNLKYYLQKNELAEKKGVKIYYNLIISAFLQVLDIAGKRNEVTITKNGKIEIQKRFYTKNSVLRHFKHKEIYDEFRQQIALWSIAIHNHNEKYNNVVINEIREYLKTDFKNMFNYNLSKMQIFIEEPKTDIDTQKTDKTEYFEHNNIKVEIGTIHSVKGETHTATLYMETFFDKGFESKRIIDYITDNGIEKLKPITKKTFKMIHVGFSRPTHLLCFAIDKKRKTNFDKSMFEIYKTI